MRIHYINTLYYFYTLALDVTAFANGLGLDLIAFLQRSDLIREAIFERAEPFSVVADARVAVDLVCHTGSAFLKDLVTATCETFAYEQIGKNYSNTRLYWQ